MQYRHGQIGIARLAASIGALAIVVGHLFVVPLAFATGTTVNASICDRVAGTLRVTSPASGSTVSKLNTIITGSVSKLSQVRAYNNGTFHMTLPLDANATTFTYTANLTAGENVIKLVGVDPCNANGPEDSVTLTLDPGAPVNPLKTAIEQTTATTMDARAYLGDQVQQASQSKPAAGLSGTAYTIMQALDLAPAGGSMQSMERMNQRFVSVVGGTALLVLAQPIFAGYHVVRYQLMQWNLPAMPQLVRRHSLFVLRLLGAGLFASAFLF